MLWPLLLSPIVVCVGEKKKENPKETRYNEMTLVITSKPSLGQYVLRSISFIHPSFFMLFLPRSNGLMDYTPDYMFYRLIFLPKKWGK